MKAMQPATPKRVALGGLAMLEAASKIALLDSSYRHWLFLHWASQQGKWPQPRSALRAEIRIKNVQRQRSG